MRKLISISLIILSLFTLVNCSPKTAKTTASSTDSKRESSSTSKTSATSTNTTTNTTNTTSTSGNAGNTPWSGKTIDEQVAMFKTANPERQDMGKKIYMSSCGTCHDLYAVDSRDASSWVKIMEKMGPNAKLDVGQYMHVSSYLVNNAKR